MSWDDFSDDGPLLTDSLDDAGVAYLVADGSGTDPDQFVMSGGVLSIPGVIDGDAGIWVQQLASGGGCCDGYNLAFTVANLAIGPDPVFAMATGFVTIGSPGFSLSGVGVVIGWTDDVGTIIPAEDTNLPIADLTDSFRAWDDNPTHEIEVGDRVWIRVHTSGPGWVMDLYVNGMLVETYTLTEFDPPTATNYGAMMIDEGEIGISLKSVWCDGAEPPVVELAAPEITEFFHADNEASGSWNEVPGADHYRYRFCYGNIDT